MDLITKYIMIIDGKRRRYVYPLPEKLFDLEHTCPDYLDIGGEHIEASSWGELIVKLTTYLLDLREEYQKRILLFVAPWTKANIFVTEKRINHVEIKPGLFVNINHTALHSCWLVIDLLEYFSIDFSTCKLVIHRLPKAEPTEVRDYYREETKKELRVYLRRCKLFSDEKIEKVIRNIDYLNQVFAKRKSGYDDLYLFDDATMFGTMKSKFITEFASSRPDKEKSEKLAKIYLGYLTDFYRDCGYYYKEN